MLFIDKLNKIIRKNNSLLCIGLDPEIEKLPKNLQKEKSAIFAFNKAIIDETADLVCAYKPNSAFYEALGIEGEKQLKMTIDYLKKNYPNIFTILDAKRADIGNTNEKYAQSIFDYFGFDAVTVHPYLGYEAIKPFLDRKDKGIIILCRTSNPGASEFQDLIVDGRPLYTIVAQRVISDWNKNNNCLLVVGATYPKELKEIRTMTDEMVFLVPGIGAQGADLEPVLKAGLDSRQKGLIINVARSVIYASSGRDFAKKARCAAEKLRDEINKYRYKF